MTDFWADKRVLITGGAGYLAYSLLNLLKDRAASMVRLDRPGSEFFPVVACHEQRRRGTADIKNIEADLRDPSVWESLIEDVDIIFHLAAQTSAVKADASPDEDLAINVTPVTALIKTCRKMQAVPTVLFAGTATECGLSNSLPVNETVLDNPITTYDRHKLMAENELKRADQEGVLKAITLRLANLYGPGPRSGSADRGILNRMIQRALSGEPLTVYGTGEYIRDYLFVEDAACAFLAAAEHIEAVHGGHFVIGSEVGNTVKRAFNLVAERVADLSSIQTDVTLIAPPAPLPAIETRNFVADSSRFSEQTGWRADVDLITGLDRTIEFYEGSA
jgi:nucleoside-diphosphate-sugar epimerase